MAHRDAIVAYLDDELEAAAYRDYGPQRPAGRRRRRGDARLRVAVSASLDVFERAAADGAQMLVVHHGLFWDGASPVIGTLERRRLETLFRHDLSLVAYHLPLDGHAVLGNNARARGDARHRRARAVRASYRGRSIGRHGALPRRRAPPRRGRPCSASALGSTPLVFPRRPGRRCARVGVDLRRGRARDPRGGGARARLLRDRRAGGGRAVPRARSSASRSIAAGHNATETVGVRAVAARLAEEFGIDTGFLPVGNPV